MDEEKPKNKLRSSPWGPVLFTVLLLLICIPLQLALLQRNTRQMADDAMISARYARNLAWGRGLRYNLAPAGARPVEGYSNFLWTLGMALGERWRLQPRVATAAMGWASSLIAVMALGFWVRRRTGSSLAGLLSALVLASSLPWTLWAGQGLETPLFAALALLAVAVADPERPRPYEYLFSFLACLTRPDGLIVAAAVLIPQLLHSHYGGADTPVGPKAGDKSVPATDHFADKGHDLRRLARAAAWFLVPFAAYTIWRMVYFRALLPNVFYAKTGLGPRGVLIGAHYVTGWAAGQWPLFLLLLAGAAALLAGKRMSHERRALAAPGMLAGLYMAFIISVGGDFMPDFRFMVHLMPVIIGMGAISLAGAAPSSAMTRKAVFALAAVAALAWNAHQLVSYARGDSFARDWHQNQAVWYGRASSWLLRHSAPSDVIACGDIGYIGYVTGVDRILDTNGLVDPYLAARPGAAALDSEPGYVLQQKPRFIVVMVHHFQDGAILGHSAFDRAVRADPALGRDYTLAAQLPGWKSVEKSWGDGKTRTSMVRFRIYQRKDEG
ncbi:MAG TPA: hypothetical protein VM658_21130 [bacterium]|nr:hypothetical protein [bacterium]